MPFVPGYSAIAADIQDMTRKEFNWDKRTWDKDYENSFQRMCVALRDSVAIFYPNYEWKWVVRTDASDYAVGAVVLQFDPVHKVWQPIAFLSKKLSDVAFRWSIIEKEAYAIYYAVYTYAYYLRVKDFTLETDHRNLLWMECSTTPKIIRWRVYLQSFTWTLLDILGKNNEVADYFSRAMISLVFMSADEFYNDDYYVMINEQVEFIAQENVVFSGQTMYSISDCSFHNIDAETSVYKAIESAHLDGMQRHWGVTRTYEVLLKMYPTNQIPKLSSKIS